MKIPGRIGHGLAHVTKLATILNDVAADLKEAFAKPPLLAADDTELRTQFNALLAKLDADAGVTDANYVATLTPAAATYTAMAARKTTASTE